MDELKLEHPLPVAFVSKWDVAKPESGSLLLWPHTRTADGMFRPFECGFTMNRIVLEELLSQLAQAAKTVGSNVINSSGITIRFDPSSKYMQLVFTTASGHETVMRLDAEMAIRLSQDLAAAAAHIRT